MRSTTAKSQRPVPGVYTDEEWLGIAEQLEDLAALIRESVDRDEQANMWNMWNIHLTEKQRRVVAAVVQVNNR